MDEHQKQQLPKRVNLYRQSKWPLCYGRLAHLQPIPVCVKCGAVNPELGFTDSNRICRYCSNARMRNFHRSPEQKAKRKAFDQSPEGKARIKAYSQTAKRKTYVREWQRAPKRRAYKKNYCLIRRYGLTIESWNEAIDKQDNKCACCSAEFQSAGTFRPVVDHCHETTMVRGIICQSCNNAEGHIRDKEHLAALTRYMFGADLDQLLLFGKN